MRYLDWNGSGGLDARDIATSVAMETRRADEDEYEDGETEESRADRDGFTNANAAGCTTLIVPTLITLATLAIII